LDSVVDLAYNPCIARIVRSSCPIRDKLGWWIETSGGKAMAKATVWTALFLIILPTAAIAKNTQFWNLTTHTITSLQLSAAGKSEWGRNQTDNDSDHAVDNDERLKITGAASGVYDVKIVDDSGRRCIVENIQIKEGTIFSIEEKNLSGCAK
jgi:hypothetical protein